MGALVVRGNLERAAGARRGLFEDQRDVLADELRLFVVAVLGSFQIPRECHEKADLRWRKVNQVGEIAIAEVYRHYGLLTFDWIPLSTPKAGCAREPVV